MAFVAYNNTYCVTLRRTLKVPFERVMRAIESEAERSLWLDPPLRFEFYVGGYILSAEGMPIAQFVEYVRGQRWVLRWISPLNQSHSKVVVEFVRAGRTTTRILVRHWQIENEKDYHELYAGWLWFLDSIERYFISGKYLEYDYPDVYGSV
ncbi:MAG: SRPBCC domain-containing protein [Chlorobi bacterium]|nr:SRPBCC domain-containing protein [Chlorobiota bacterium]